MAFTGATFNLLVNTNYPAVDGDVIDEVGHNAMLEDLATGLTAVVTRDGAGSMSGNLNMGTHKITNLLAGASASDAIRYDQAQLASAVATAWEGLSWAANKLGYATGAATFALTDLTAAGRALLDDADASAQRTTLGLGTAALATIGTSGDTVPKNNTANVFSADQTISSTGPNFYLQETDASANNQLWRMLAQGEDLYFGAVNDALSSAGYWAVISRTGITIDAIALAATALTLNSVAIPTISSSDTLSNKTISSPTLSGTVAGAHSYSGVVTHSANIESSTYIDIKLSSGNAYARLTGRYDLTGAAHDEQLLSCNYNYATGARDSTSLGTAGIRIRGTNAGPGTIIFETGAVNTAPSTRAIIDNTGLQAPVAVSSETSGTLTSTSANKHLALAGNITLNNSVFTANDKMTLDPGTSARTITRGAGCTMYVNGTDSATATLAANQMGGVHVRSASVFVLTGAVS